MSRQTLTLSDRRSSSSSDIEKVRRHRERRDAAGLPRAEALHRILSEAMLVVWPRLPDDIKSAAIECVRLEARMRELDADGVVQMVERRVNGSIVQNMVT